MATSINTSSAAMSVSGLASGIDTSSIIDGLTRLNQRRVSDLQSKQAAVSLKLTTFGGIQAQLLNLQSKLTRLARSVNGAFDGRTATSSDGTILQAAAGASAQPGTYNLQVQSLARAQQIASSGLANTSTTIKQGTVVIQVGSGSATTITIDSSNNTLQGLANAINASGADVRAAIINDGSATPYRLVLSSNKTGAANTISVTNNLTSGTGESPNFSQSVLQTAADASVIIGSGAGALTINSASNSINNLIAGVTVNLTKEAPGQTVKLTIAADTNAASQAITDFVDAYNSIIDFINQRSTYDAQSQSAGVLLGNNDAQALEADLANAIVQSVGGVNQKLNRLTAIGVSFGDDGKLKVDSSRLDQALNGQIAGVTASDFKRLFALTGTSTNSGVNFVLGSDRTRGSGTTPYSVEITQAATAAQILGTDDLADSIDIDSGNNTFKVKVNGVTSSMLTIADGTYTPEELAAAVQTLINSDPALSTNPVTVTVESGKLSVRSSLIGSASRVEFLSGLAIVSGGPLGLDGPVTAHGNDVAGHFIVNNVVESATGLGQVLSGSVGNLNTSGMQVNVTLSPGDLVSGAEADLTITQGIASRLNQVLYRYLDPTIGRLKTVSDGFQRQIDDFAKTIDTQNDLLERKKAQLVAQFAAMESSISGIKTLSDQLAAQFSSLNAIRQTK